MGRNKKVQTKARGAMESMPDVLGAKLVGKDGEVATETALSDKKCVALFFGSEWNEKPSQTWFGHSTLAKEYMNDMHAKGLQIVFVSFDEGQEAFKYGFGEKPFLSLPYMNRDKRKELSKKYGVRAGGARSIVILAPNEKLITKDDREALHRISKLFGVDIHWGGALSVDAIQAMEAQEALQRSKDMEAKKCKSKKLFTDVFSNAKLIGHGGVERQGSDLLGKTMVGLYFSAHWCPPCRSFTPKLAEMYKTSLKEKGLEVVFVSSDHDDAAFEEYFGEQPWLALDYSDRKRKDQLSKIFEVDGIPSFVILDKDGSIITKDGREAVIRDPTGAEFPAWPPKPVAHDEDPDLVSTLDETTSED